MRLSLLLLALPLGIAPAAAQTTPVATPAAAPPAAAPAPHHRMTWEQRFAQANMSHDGHLTLEQARGGYVSIARHFNEIDTDGKGYVTTDDIRAWHRQRRAARHKEAPQADELRPRPAYHRHTTQNTFVEAPAGHSSAAPAVPSGEPPPPPRGLDVRIDPDAPS